MNNTRKNLHRSGTFLLELVIAILFFSLSGAVCVQVFVEAGNTSKEAALLSQAVGVCGNAAEVIRGAGSPREAEYLLTSEFPGLIRENSTLRAPLSGDCSLEITESAGDCLYQAQIRYLNKTGSCIYTLQLTRYFAEETA